MKQKHIHYHFHLGSGPPAILSRLDTIMTTLAELTGRVEAQTAQLVAQGQQITKITDETRSLIATVAALTEALQNVELPAAAVDALDAADAQIQVLGGLLNIADELVPDAVQAP
jgi:hypothetical protein